jgi:hypothetical protein
VDDERDDRGDRERLVGGAQVRSAALEQPAADEEAGADADAREQQRERASGATGDPEEMVV